MFGFICNCRKHAFTAGELGLLSRILDSPTSGARMPISRGVREGEPVKVFTGYSDHG